MANRSKDKGDRLERETVQQFDFIGIKARRTLTSGARSQGEHTHDIDAYPWGIDNAAMIGECKARGRGFKQLYEWIEDNDFLVCKADRREPLWVFPQRMAMELLEAYKRG